MSIEVVRSLDQERWQSFVNDHPHGNIFHTPEMFQAFSRAKGHRPSLWAATDSDGRPLALLLPVKVAVLGGILTRMTARSVIYGGVLCEDSPEGRAALGDLLEAYNRGGDQGSLFTEVRNLADTEPLQPVLQQHGYAYEAHQDFLIDLSMPAEDVWKNMKKSARKGIRRALNKKQLTIEEVHDPGQITTWYSVLERTYHKAQVPLADQSLFRAAFDILYPKGMVQFLLGRTDDAYVAASVALLNKDVIYGWYRGFDRAYSSYLPNDLMVWHVLQWGAANGYRLFDFGGAGRPDEDYGPRKFKAKFGGQLVCYGRNRYVHAPALLRLSQRGYEVYRRFV